jgi:lysophospholipase L1-like esterase
VSASRVTGPLDFSTYSTEADLPRVAFLGDSWAGGAGSADGGAQNSYAGKAGRMLGGPFEVFPGGGTGYTTGNPATGEGPFIDRVPALIEYAPDIVVVQGSSNDYRASGGEIEAAALGVFTTIREALPDAQIYVVGVIDSPASPNELMQVSRDAISSAAAEVEAVWVDANAGGWLDINADFADGYHPNEQGHQKVAERVVALLG